MKRNPFAEQAPVLVARTLNDLIAGYSLDFVAREWLVMGLLSYLRGQVGSLDEALGLACGGKVKPRRVIVMHVRDCYLWKAIEAVSLDEKVSTWARCQRLAKQIDKLFPVWKMHYLHTSRAPEEWEQWKADLFMAWRASCQGGGNIPETDDGLFKLAERTQACSFGSDALTMVASYLLE